MIKKRFFSASIAVIITIILILPATVLPASADTAVNIGTESHDTPLSIWESDDELGTRVYITAPFTAISFLMPTWNDQTFSYSTTISAYKWDTGYEKTVISPPIYEKRFTGLVDNAENVLEFPSPLPAGEYLFLIHDSVGQVGCWAKSGNESNTVTYQDGAEIDYCLRMYVYFAGDPPAEPFGEGLSPTEKYGNAPYYPYHAQDVREIPDAGLPESSLFRRNFSSSDCFSLEDTEIVSKPDRKVAVLYDGDVSEELFRTLAEVKIDAVFLNFTSVENCLEALETCYNVQKSGTDAPEIAFIMPDSVSSVTIRSTYLNVFRTGKFNSAWFYLDGNPLLILKDRYFNLSKPIEKEITDFFTIRSFSDYEWKLPDDYPQEIFYNGTAEQMGLNLGGDLQKQFEYADEISPEILILNGNIDALDSPDARKLLYSYKGVKSYELTAYNESFDFKNINEWCNIPYFALEVSDTYPIGMQVAFDKNCVYILAEYLYTANPDLSVELRSASSIYTVNKTNSQTFTDGRYLIFKANRSDAGADFKENGSFPVIFTASLADRQFPDNGIYFALNVTDGISEATETTFAGGSETVNEDTIPDESGIPSQSVTDISNDPGQDTGCDSALCPLGLILPLFCFIYIFISEPGKSRI